MFEPYGAVDRAFRLREVPDGRKRWISHCAAANPEYGTGVAKAIDAIG
jgi:hypothetical protein